jgi:hypothetical protein
VGIKRDKLKGLRVVGLGSPAPRPSKYRNRRDKRDGYGFDSKAEARYYDQLRLLVAAGEVLFYARQVPIDLGAGKVYRVDFIVIYADGRIRFVDVKGHETKVFKLKKALVEDKWPITIDIVKAKEVKK